MLQCDSDTNANLADRSPSGTRAFACALTLQAASCTMNWVRALSSAVRAFGLHPKGRPFKSDSAHHCDAPPFSGDVVQLVRTLPCHGRGREFESRRPRHSFQKSCIELIETNEGANGHVFAPFLHPFSSIRVVFIAAAATLTCRVYASSWRSSQR